MLNGFEIDATVDEQAAVVLSVAAGGRARDSLIEWLRKRFVRRPQA